MEDIIGTLEPGKKADLVVLDRDPYLSDPYAIHSIEVDLIVYNGRLVYEKKINSSDSHLLGALAYER